MLCISDRHPMSPRSGCDPEPERLDEIREEELEEIALRYRLICLLQNGVGPKEALSRLGINRTPRWARKLRQRYEAEGMAGLRDGRRRNGAPASVMTGDVIKVILKWWFGRPAAGPRTVWKKAADECRELGLAVPNYESVKKYLAEIPEPYHATRDGRMRKWSQQGRPVVRYDLSQYANDRVQIDHTELDLWVRAWRDGEWVPVRAWATAAIDEFSRSVAGIVISTKHPDAWTVSLLLMDLVKPKRLPQWKNCGLPRLVQIDNGRDLVSHSALAVYAELGVQVEVDPPRYPDNKGKVERFFRTLDTSCLRGLPGHFEAIGRSEVAAYRHTELLLTRRQLRAEVERWIAEDYHQRTHQETERKPAELWEEAVRLRMYENEELFHAMLLKSDRIRVVRNTGIDFGNARYWAPELTDWWKRSVRVRYNPEDMESILVYCAATGDYICEAWVMGQEDSRYTIEDVKRERTQYRLGLRARLEQYAEEVREHDRRVAREDWTPAREIAAEIEESEELMEAGADEVARLIEEIRRRERGEG